MRVPQSNRPSRIVCSTYFDPFAAVGSGIESLRYISPSTLPIPDFSVPVATGSYSIVPPPASIILLLTCSVTPTLQGRVQMRDLISCSQSSLTAAMIESTPPNGPVVRRSFAMYSTCDHESTPTDFHFPSRASICT